MCCPLDNRCARTRLTASIGFTILVVLGIMPVVTSHAFAQGGVPRILLGDETTDYESVGIVGSIQRGGFCTGTLIGPNHVLTAAHCAETIEDELSGTFEVNGELYMTAEIFIHPDYNSRTLDNDLAILRLSEPVLNVDPSAIFRDSPLVGDLLFIVGFGGTGTAEDGNDGTFGVKRVGITTIDEVTDTLVSWIFDDESETNTTAGDSGGPGYIDIDGNLFVASVTSGGTNLDSSLGDFAFNTRVDAFADWIDLVVATTPADPPAQSDPIADSDPPNGDGDCAIAFEDSVFGMLFGSNENSPFPILQTLIDFLTWLLDALLAELDQAPADPATPTEPGTPTSILARSNRSDNADRTQPIQQHPAARQPIQQHLRIQSIRQLPTDPSDPTTPADPTDPTTPTDPADPTDPAEPTFARFARGSADDRANLAGSSSGNGSDVTRDANRPCTHGSDRTHGPDRTNGPDRPNRPGDNTSGPDRSGDDDPYRSRCPDD